MSAIHQFKLRHLDHYGARYELLYQELIGDCLTPSIIPVILSREELTDDRFIAQEYIRFRRMQERDAGQMMQTSVDAMLQDPNQLLVVWLEYPSGITGSDFVPVASGYLYRCQVNPYEWDFHCIDILVGEDRKSITPVLRLSELCNTLVVAADLQVVASGNLLRYLYLSVERCPDQHPEWCSGLLHQIRRGCCDFMPKIKVSSHYSSLAERVRTYYERLRDDEMDFYTQEVTLDTLDEVPERALRWLTQNYMTPAGALPFSARIALQPQPCCFRRWFVVYEDGIAGHLAVATAEVEHHADTATIRRIGVDYQSILLNSRVDYPLVAHVDLCQCQLTAQTEINLALLDELLHGPINAPEWLIYEGQAASLLPTFDKLPIGASVVGGRFRIDFSTPFHRDLTRAAQKIVFDDPEWVAC